GRRAEEEARRSLPRAQEEEDRQQLTTSPDKTGRVEAIPAPGFSFPSAVSAAYLSQMADTFQTIIDTGVRPGEADHLARHLVSFLAERGVIAATPSEEGGYPRGPRALEIAEAAPLRPAHEAIPPSYSHLQVMIGRATHSKDMSEARA